MANHPSAVKRDRQGKKQRARNVGIRKVVRAATKAAQAALQKKDPTKAKGPVASAVRAIAKAKSKGVLHWRTAARVTSRLAKAVVRAARR